MAILQECSICGGEGKIKAQKPVGPWKINLGGLSHELNPKKTVELTCDACDGTGKILRGKQIERP